MKKYLIAFSIFAFVLAFSFFVDENVAQRMNSFVLVDSLGNVDTTGTGTGNKYVTDTLKIDMSRTAYGMGCFQVLIKLTDTTSANGKLPAVGLVYGNLRANTIVDGQIVYSRLQSMTAIAIPDSPSTVYTHNITDSVKHFGIDNHYLVDSPDVTEGIFVVVKNTDGDTSKVPYDRKIYYELQVNLR